MSLFIVGWDIVHLRVILQQLKMELFSEIYNENHVEKSKRTRRC